MELHITFFASAIETLTIYFIITLLDNENRMPLHKVAIYIVLASITITIGDFIGLHYQFMVNFLSYTVLLRVLLKKSILLLFTDLIVACGCYAFMQLISSIIIGHFHVNILENYYLLFIMLCLFALISYGVSICDKISKPISKFYTNNRDIVIWITTNLFFSIIIVSHLWNDLGDFFWRLQWSILILIFIIYALNGGLLISFLHKKKQKEKMQGYQEYGEYLEEMMNQLSSRQHEFANQINVIMGLAQTKKGESLSAAIMEYGERILDAKKRTFRQSIICDDSMIAAMLYRKSTEAEKANIQFEYLLENPFPHYSASPYDLVELLVNLINNAFEAVTALAIGERQVFLKMNTGSIEVINTVPSNFDTASIAKFSKSRYSTKGYQRGYGVSNIKTILNKYHGQLEIYSQDNMIVFSILLP